ncbi:MAG TPA: NAD(+) synthase, partial [bacterium]|nr:NAD(+) synthase [bacterium]
MIVLPTINYKNITLLLTDFIRNEFRKSGFEKAVLGLSGGIDSAVVTVLAAKALGPENVTGILMPYKSSSRSSIEDAMKIVEMTEVNHKIVEITEAVNSIESFNMVQNNRLKAVTLGNVVAKVRMSTLVDFSSSEKALVLGA